MARLPRLVIPHQPHLLIQRGHNRQPVFLDDEDHRRFLEALAAASRDTRVAIHAYVLMADHIHLLLTPPTADALGRMMQRLGRQYVPAFNERHQRSGTLWDGRFRAAVLEPERFLLDAQRHLELNPVRHKLVSRPQDWPWSSAAHHIGLRRDPLITEHPLYWQLGNTPFEREAAYRATHERPLDDARAQEIRNASEKGWALGGEAFLRAAGKSTERRLSPMPKGRPRTKT